MSKSETQFNHNISKARRQRELEELLKKERRTRCAVCDHISEPDDFLCRNCGFDFSLEISYNDYGLPDINF